MPPRTGRTSLTDDELCLFDALFDAVDRVGALSREEFAAHNLPYAHDLDAPALDRTVRQLGNAGLVRLRAAATRPELGPWIGLTAAGGTWWELERSPDWNRFCRVSSAPEEISGAWTLTILAVEAAVVDDFLDTAAACGLYAPVPGAARCRLSRRSLVPWQPARRVVELRVPLETDGEAPGRVTDWPMYEAQRSWWRSVAELATLMLRR